MDGDIVGVRIIPPVIEFYDAEAATIHCQNITVQNISPCSKQIKFHGPDSEKFKLLVENPSKPVAPGLEVTATVEFSTDESQDYQDRIILQVDEDVIEIPLCAYSPQPLLDLEGPVDFGSVLRNCKVLSKEITLSNHGSLPGNFIISYTGKQPVTIIPTKGTLKPHTAQSIKVEFVTKYAGTLNEEAKVQLEGQEPSILQIQADVVDCSLQLLSPKNGKQLNCIQFGCTYYGTDRTRAAVLFNNSPDVVKFVTVLDTEAEGMEMGADLTKSTTQMLSLKDTLAKTKDCSNSLTSLITAFPNQGVLQPYQKIPIFLRFSPRYSSSKQGWKGTSTPPPRQDFALFMNIITVGSTAGFEDSNKEEMALSDFKLEVAMTGTALPVLLDLLPQTTFHFNECPVNEHVDSLATLKNDSAILPVSFAFRPVAQFAVHPSSGKLKPGESKDILITFKPNQYGNFRVMEQMDVLGESAGSIGEARDPLETVLEVIYTVHILLSGQGISTFKKKEPKFNPGITPLVVGEVGQHVEVKMDELKPFQPRVAVLGAPNTKNIHTMKSMSLTRDDKALVAYPNDRARSVRPSYRREDYKTIFTKADRHTYVDNDYAYDDEELKNVQDHKNKYNTYLQESRAKRLAKSKARVFTELNNATDIGLKSSPGLKPPKATARDVKPYLQSPVPPENSNQMLSTKQLQDKEDTARIRPCSGGLNAVPMTMTEKTDCKKKLTPQQIHQVMIGPGSVNFGEVCLKSTSVQKMDIVNCLEQCVHVVMEIDCKELRQSSPLSQVVPPNTKAVLPLVFESNTPGKFQRNVTYTINGHHTGHVIVYADIVLVALELSSETLHLSPTPGLPAEAGLRDVIALKNKRNYPAEFQWQPVLGERGTAFSIRPAAGVVEAFHDLECEVVFHPSYHAPEDGEFIVQVNGGEHLRFRCNADLGPTQVMFMERRVLFGQVPLHLTTSRTALLHNHSQNHAFFQVVDPNPVPGLTVSPTQGVVPVGGTTELRIDFTPSAVMKFDTRLEVDIRGWRTIELRMGGTVEPPVVDIDVSSFQLGGVYCGSSISVPFKLINKAKTRAKVVFDLSRYRDFTLKFDADVMEECEDSLHPGIFKATIQGATTMKCSLEFAPTEVASYDFIIPVNINQTEAPMPDPTPLPPTPAPSSKSIQHIIAPRPVSVTVLTPKRRIVATALRQPLEVSHHNLDFTLPSGFLRLKSDGGKAQCKGTLLINNSAKVLRWSLDCKGCGTAVEEGVFQFVSSKGMPFLSPREGGSSIEDDTLEPGQTYSLGIKFCPSVPGEYSAKVPFILNGETERPYQYLHLYGILHAPKLTFDPLSIVMTPVPLSTCTSTDLTVHAHGFTSTSVIDVELPEIEAGDGSKITVLDVTFLEGQTVRPVSGDHGQGNPVALQCRVNFSSPKPVSFTKEIKFLDSDGNSFSVPVTATADNCLLTAYPFVAQHRMDFQIVTEQGRTLPGHHSESKESLNGGGGGEAIFMAIESPSRPPTHTSSSTSSRFGVTSSTYEESETVTESTYPSTPRDGAVNRANRGQDSQVIQAENLGGIASRSLGSAVFPNEETEEGIFHQEVLTAVQRWITLHGWPGGPFPVLVPDGLRSGVSKGSAADAAQDKSSKTPATNNQKKNYTKTIYDLLAHLSGRPVPGIPVNQALPSDPTERVLQLHWQHTTMMTFLKTQGASISHIRPEFLFEPQDYYRWTKLQTKAKEKKLMQEEGTSSPLTSQSTSSILDEALFESVSKRAWTDLMLQTIKVLVLSRLTPRLHKNLPAPCGLPLPAINPDPLCSNIYSVGERILLSWLNHHYESQRHKVWHNADKGGVPASRWVVNFDYDLLDGLVLGAVLAAHVPFITETHLLGMYTHPSTAEQCLHNALKVVTALRYIGLDYDIQAIDITDPNPVSLLMLCVHLYQRLPQYNPKTTVEFVGTLHQTVLRQVQLSNPSNKPLVYHAIIAGKDARDFHLPKGDIITIPPKTKHDLKVNFTSRFLRPAHAVLVLVGRRAGAVTGTTLVFNMRTVIDNITPAGVIKCESPCYQLQRVDLEICNPFKEAGEFKIILAETVSLTDGKSADLVRKKDSIRRVRSKVDHGQRKERTPSPVQAEEVSTDLDVIVNKGSSSEVTAFYVDSKSVRLEAESSAIVSVDFLPFHLGKFQCSVLLINEDVGEFIYSVDATALLPVPSTLPYVPSVHSMRITSGAAAGKGRGHFGGDDQIIYWSCESNTVLKEELIVPATNVAKERALVIAAQKGMSATERYRRHITDTMTSSTVTAAVAELKLSETRDGGRQFGSSSMDSGNSDVAYQVEVSSKYFQAPSVLYIPSIQSEMNPSSKGKKSPQQLDKDTGIVMDSGSAALPIKFTPKGGGNYPCQVILKSAIDIRVYQIECIVKAENSATQIEFMAPVHQSVSQDIPVVNHSDEDWYLTCTIEGPGFFGPHQIVAHKGKATKYPLMFRPSFESLVKGKLTLLNQEDGTEHHFSLRGQAQKPLALDHIIVTCVTGEKVEEIVRVPNVTGQKLTYRAESDLEITSGPATVTVLPGKEEEYRVQVAPWKRGTFKGVLSFVAGGLGNFRDNGNHSASKSRPVSGKSTASSASSNSQVTNDAVGYRVWYTIEIQSEPAPPKKVIDISCCAQSAALMEVEVYNPLTRNLAFDVTIEGSGLSGEPQIEVEPGRKKYYQLVFAPSSVGATQGSLIFQNQAVGETWYKLNLTSETPAPTVCPHMECELGKWSRQFISLTNPTQETLILVPKNSNTNNFTLEIEQDKTIFLAPQSATEIPVQFMPSALGQAGHSAVISFNCEQLGDWKFLLSGTGLTPTPMDPVSVSAILGSNTSLIIPFRNPTDEQVLVDVILTDNTNLARATTDQLGSNRIETESAFCLLLKHTSNIPVAPKATLDVPLTFAPGDMTLHEALCVISIRREDGMKWEEAPSTNPDHPQAVHRSDVGLKEIRWLYPIHGVPESHPKANRGAVVNCQARSRIEERLQVTLTGAVAASSYTSIHARAITPKDHQKQEPDGVVVGEGNAVASEFSYEFLFNNEESRSDLEHSVSINLVRKERDHLNGTVNLIFNVIFSPFKVMKHDIQLCVTGATGGVWRFPLRFNSTEPPIDDVITIESSGLNRESSVGFRLTSQAKHPSPFTAYFVAGSDLEFTVSPQSGELHPIGTKGTLITVGFTPKLYGKSYQAKLVVQTSDMQWTYSIVGLIPEYNTPNGRSNHPIAGPHPSPVKRGKGRNFILENLNLTTTAVSSPIKGATILSKH